MTTEARDPRVQRLVFELVDAAPAPPPFPDADVAVADRVATRAHRPRTWAVALAAALLVFGIVGAVVIARRTPARKAPVTGPGRAPAVAYVDGRGLVVRAPSGDETVVVSHAVSAPRWSPTGDWIAYRDRDHVSVVPQSGGTPVPIETGTYAWSPRLDVLATTSGAGVHVWSFAGPQPRSVEIDPPVGGVDPTAQSVAWTSDGTSLAIAMERREHAGPGAPVASLWVAERVCSRNECGTPRSVRRIPYTPGPDDYPLLVAGFGFDDTRVLFWTDYQGSGSVQMDGLPLRAVDVDTGTATNIATTIVRDSWVQPSPDGSQLLVVRSNGRMVTDPREVDVCTSPDACAAIAPAREVQTLDPAWSPDGRRIAFVREGHASFTPPVTNGTIDWATKYRSRALWIANPNGSDAHEITAAGQGIADPQFSPDGKSIVFVRDARMWQFDMATGQVEPLGGSLRPTTECTFDNCLPDAEPYETTNLWSNYYAVKFAAGS